MKIKKFLKQLGIKKIRPTQKEAVNSLLQNNDTIVAIATGMGKSLIFQLFHLIKQENIIVISPLISLMQDQSLSLKNKNINSIIFNSTSNENQLGILSIRVKNIIKGNEKAILFFSPESLIKHKNIIKKLIKKNRVCVIVFDEVHLVCDWSSFRREYKNLHIIKDYITKYKKVIPQLALSATLPKLTIKYIIENLKLNNPKIIKSTIYKESLSITIKKKDKQTINEIYKLIKNLDNNSKSIIFCKTRKDSELIQNVLSQKPYNLNIKFYNAGIDTNLRQKIQKEFTSKSLNIISCTIAFGMGIDIPNIHLCIHYGISKNIDSYIQEIGRTSRDGLPGKCVTYYSKRDFVTNRFFVDTIEDEYLKKYEMDKLNKLSEFIYDHSRCRMKNLCSYFGEILTENCKKCDICLNLNKDTNNNNISSYMKFIILNSFKEMRFGGKGSLITLLLGKSKNPRIKNLKNYGILKDFDKKIIEHYIRILINKSYFEVKSNKNSFGSYLILTKKSELILKIKDKINKNVKIIKDFVKKNINKLKIKINKDSNSRILNKKILEDLLKTWRIEKSIKLSKPAYCILTNRSIDEICNRLPKNKENLLNIHGIGDKKLKNYGDEILKLIS